MYIYNYNYIYIYIDVTPSKRQVPAMEIEIEIVYGGNSCGDLDCNSNDTVIFFILMFDLFHSAVEF